MIPEVPMWCCAMREGRKDTLTTEEDKVTVTISNFKSGGAFVEYLIILKKEKRGYNLKKKWKVQRLKGIRTVFSVI